MTIEPSLSFASGCAEEQTTRAKTMARGISGGEKPTYHQLMSCRFEELLLHITHCFAIYLSTRVLDSGWVWG